MLLPIIIAMSQARAYDAALVLTLKASPGVHSYIGGVHVLDDGGVVGFACDAVGVHGETFFARPFVWSGGIVHWLPIAEEHGHICWAGSNRLAGDIEVNNLLLPAIWTSDPIRGWAAAKVSRVDAQEGHVVAVERDGTIWVQGEEHLRVIRNGVSKTLNTGKFDFEGLGPHGEILGNALADYASGYVRVNEHAVSVNPNTLVQTQLSAREDFAYIVATNAIGDAVGQSDHKACIWVGGVGRQLPSHAEWGYPRQINRRRQIVGSYRDGEVMRACLWDRDAYADLSHAIPDVRLDEAVAISDNGVIAATVSDRQHSCLYVLYPHPRR